MNFLIGFWGHILKVNKTAAPLVVFGMKHPYKMQL
jgi:hypothetical protein